MADFNRVIEVGRLTRDVDLRFTANGSAVATLSMVVNHKYKKNDEWQENPSFFNVVAWNRTAENAAEYLKKGSSLLVEGRLQSKQWEDQEGKKRYGLEVFAEKIQFLDSKKKSQQQDNPYPDDGGMIDPDDDQVPF